MLCPLISLSVTVQRIQWTMSWKIWTTCKVVMCFFIAWCAVEILVAASHWAASANQNVTISIPPANPEKWQTCFLHKLQLNDRAKDWLIFNKAFRISNSTSLVTRDFSCNQMRQTYPSHLSLKYKSRCCTTDDFTTSFLHFSLFSTALWDLANSRPIHFLMLSSHLFLCQPCLLPPFTVPCQMVLARPDECETWPYHCGLHLFTMIRRSPCGQIACWTLARTSSLVTWS